TGERLWAQGTATEALVSERARNRLAESTRRVGSTANLSSTLPARRGGSAGRSAATAIPSLVLL
ncbi:MAG: hypothetical protein AB1649_15885, partial [Chloroflexota bacterium]